MSLSDIERAQRMSTTCSTDASTGSRGVEQSTVVGRVSRKRPLSKRLCFFDLQTDDGLASVIVKNECGGVGSAAAARSDVKVGDLLRVTGIREPDGGLLATHMAIELAWRESASGVPFGDTVPVPDAVPVATTVPEPDAVAVAVRGPALGICKAWLNTGRCARQVSLRRQASARPCVRLCAERWPSLAGLRVPT